MKLNPKTIQILNNSNLDWQYFSMVFNDDLREARNQDKASKDERRLKKGDELTAGKATGISLINKNYQINLLV